MKKKKSEGDDNGGIGEGRIILSAFLSVLCLLLVGSTIAVACIRASSLRESFASLALIAPDQNPPDFDGGDFFTVPILELQTKVNGAGSSSSYEPARAVSAEEERSIGRNVSIAVKSPLRKRTITKTKKIEEGLARARHVIRKAASTWKLSTPTFSGGIYRNPRAFHRSYMEMERRLKVFVYEEGELPIVHDGPCKNIYASEGRFIAEMEHGRNHRFRTKDPHSAHVYFMPFSVTWMVKYLYKPLTYDVSPLQHFVSDYVRVISTRHPFWNRTQGADHFMLSCHDWGPLASRGNANVYNTSIRVLCNANSSEGFNPQKDVSLPEIHLYTGNISPKLLQSNTTAAPRPLLAFFAGGLHGPIRPILLRHWQNRSGEDPPIQVYEYLPDHLDYYTLMLQSKFCLCPSGHEVASPRVVEAIYAECIPVILSTNYVLPFSDVLNWDAFSLQVDVSEIPRLKEILMAVSPDEYLRLKEGVRAVRKHFVFNEPAQRYDVFHMILHSVWLRRLNLRTE